MKIEFSKDCQKYISKLDANIKKQLKNKLLLFLDNPSTPSLRKHKLSGEYCGYTSINITGDYRLVYREVNNDHIFVLAIGTHPQLYG